MRIFGLAGWSGSGKTRLLVRLAPELIRRGLRVSTIKHAHHEFDLDKHGKDSYRHREAGATEVMIASSNRWALMHELRGAPEPGLEDLLPLMSPVDLVLIEGFKRHAHPKLEIFRAELGKPMLHLEDKQILAVASETPVEGARVPKLELNDISAIADFVVARAELIGS